MPLYTMYFVYLSYIVPLCLLIQLERQKYVPLY